MTTSSSCTHAFLGSLRQRLYSVVVTTLLLLAPTGAAWAGSGGGGPIKLCLSDEGCEEGEYCDFPAALSGIGGFGTCKEIKQTRCNSDRDCPLTEECVKKSVVAEAETSGILAPGLCEPRDSCFQDSQCDSDEYCRSPELRSNTESDGAVVQGIAGGFCYPRPTPIYPECESDGDCNEGEECGFPIPIALAQEGAVTSGVLFGTCQETPTFCADDSACDDDEYCGPASAGDAAKHDASLQIIIELGECTPKPDLTYPECINQFDCLRSEACIVPVVVIGGELSGTTSHPPIGECVERCDEDADCGRGLICVKDIGEAMLQGRPPPDGLCLPDPSPEPTSTPTPKPTATSTPEPTEDPTAEPTEVQTAEPTEDPTVEPTEEPTSTPTMKFTATPTWTPVPEGEVCLGDCDGDGTVSIGELVRLVNIALGQQDIESCESMADYGSISIGDLIMAVNNSLLGCD